MGSTETQLMEQESKVRFYDAITKSGEWVSLAAICDSYDNLPGERKVFHLRSWIGIEG